MLYADYIFRREEGHELVSSNSGHLVREEGLELTGLENEDLHSRERSGR